MAIPQHDLLRWQFEMTWSLFEYHADLLKPGDFLWEPENPNIITTRDTDGRWERDWPTPEQESTGVATIGWLTWHIGWWWASAIDHVQRREPRDTTWQGPDKAVDQLRGLHAEWLEVLGSADLDAPTTFPWPEGMTVAHTVGWVNFELAKNVAEIGQLRRLAAGRPLAPPITGQ